MPASILMPLSRAEPGRWDSACAAHLLNRAAFGGTLPEIDILVNLGPDQSVDAIVNYHGTPDPLPPLHFGDLTAPASNTNKPDHGRGYGLKILGLPQEQRKALFQLFQIATRTKLEEMKAWWLDRMVRSHRQLEEKMTLFYHGLFVSSAVSVKNAYHLYLQNQLFRRYATGNFKTLTLEVSKDAAMLEYLNNDQNKKEHPNENYARELMELFTLGIGNYTEQDIKESARAFSGWTHIGPEFVFNPYEHDDGPKTFLSHSGNLDGNDIVRIIFQQPAASRYLATRLLKFFAIDDPQSPEIEALAATIRESNYDIAKTLQALFASNWFYSEDVMRRQIKPPVQLVAGSLRLLNVGVSEYAPVDNSLKIMGQELFYAPSVKGWDGGRAWVNTSTMFARFNLPAYLVTGKLPTTTKHPADPTIRDQFTDFDSTWTPQLDLADARLSTGDAVVDYYLRRLIQDKVDPHKRNELIEFLNGTGDARSHLFDPTAPEADAHLRSLVHLIMAMAEFQLC